jgi:hypothetical protein
MKRVANQTRRNVSSARREARRGLLREARRKEPIPDKLYFRIGEVARLTGVQHTIAGARRRLQEETEPADLLEQVRRIRKELEALGTLLDRS